MKMTTVKSEGVERGDRISLPWQRDDDEEEEKDEDRRVATAAAAATTRSRS